MSEELLMAIQRFRSKPPSALTAEQKVAFALLLFLGIGGVVFGFKSFGASLTRPIEQQIAKYYTGEQYLTQDEREDQELEASKTKDTDGDGLVDYDELYVYKTSPYIVDSDSDGYSDSQEVYSWNNPNCPIGKTCGFLVSSVEEDVADANITDAFLSGVDAGFLSDAGAIEFTTPEQVEAFFKQATIEQIRESLIVAGMTEEELSQIDDETLQAYLEGTLTEAMLSDAVQEGETPTN